MQVRSDTVQSLDLQTKRVPVATNVVGKLYTVRCILTGLLTVSLLNVRTMITEFPTA
jgi:hypothetical protein